MALRLGRDRAHTMRRELLFGAMLMPGLGLVGCSGSSGALAGDAGDAGYDSPAVPGDDATSPLDEAGAPDATGDAPDSTIATDGEAGSADVQVVDAAQDVDGEVPTDAPAEM